MFSCLQVSREQQQQQQQLEYKDAEGDAAETPSYSTAIDRGIHHPSLEQKPSNQRNGRNQGSPFAAQMDKKLNIQ